MKILSVVLAILGVTCGSAYARVDDTRVDDMEARAAMRSIERFIADNPDYGYRAYLMVRMGDISFARQQWGEAWDYYDMIPDKSLDPLSQAEVDRRRAMAALNLYVESVNRGAPDARYLADGKRLVARMKGPDAPFFDGYIAYLTGDYPEAKRLLRSVGASGRPASVAPFYVAQIEAAQRAGLPESVKALLAEGDLPEVYDIEADRMIGEAMYAMGDRAGALPYLERYVSQQVIAPRDGARYMLGICLYDRGDLTRAVEMLRQPAAGDGEMAQSALLAMGKALYQLGELREANLALERAVKIDAADPLTEEALHDYILVKGEGGRVPFANTSDIYEKFISRFPASKYAPEIASRMARGYLADENYEAAIAAVDRVESRSAELSAIRQQALYRMGAAELARGRYAQALKHLAEARDMKQGDKAVALECDYLIGECHYGQGDYRQARSAYEKYLAGARGDKSAPNVAPARYAVAYCHFNTGDYQGAKPQFESVVKEDQSLSKEIRADASARLADCLYYGGKLGEAIRAYDRAANLNPAIADYTSFMRAQALGYQGNLTDKIKLLNEFCKKYPSSPLVADALIELAATQRQAGRDADAIATYAEIDRRFPASAHGRRALYLMSAMQAASGQVDAAFATYRKLITRHSPSEEATAAAESFKDLAVQEGRLDDYLSFISTVDNAPKPTLDEVDDLTYRSAKTMRQLEQYLERYPRGHHADEALLALVRAASKSGDADRLLRLSARFVADYPGSGFAAEVWRYKADAEADAGMIPEALESYVEMESHSSAPDMLTAARLGLVKAGNALGRDDLVVEVADKLLANAGLTAGETREVDFMKSMALHNLGRDAEAVDIWTGLSLDLTDLTGVKSAFYLAEYYFNNGLADKAEEAVNRLIDSNTPHSYWLARGFILASDIYRSQGDDFEADEYLKVLRENYPGAEPDIYEMIDKRLAR